MYQNSRKKITVTFLQKQCEQIVSRIKNWNKLANNHIDIYHKSLVWTKYVIFDQLRILVQNKRMLCYVSRKKAWHILSGDVHFYFFYVLIKVCLWISKSNLQIALHIYNIIMNITSALVKYIKAKKTQTREKNKKKNKTYNTELNWFKFVTVQNKL